MEDEMENATTKPSCADCGTRDLVEVVWVPDPELGVCVEIPVCPECEAEREHETKKADREYFAGGGR